MTDVKDAIPSEPVRLEAGQISREVTIPMGRGRE